MKAFRAVILALLIANGCAQGQSGPGWNLMVPPLTADGSANQSAPLTQWQNLGNYGHHNTCKTALQQGQFGAGAQFGPITRAQSAMEDAAVQLMSGQCVAADDPRLQQAANPAAP